MPFLFAPGLFVWRLAKHRNGFARDLGNTVGLQEIPGIKLVQILLNRI